jgi:Spy/CpxP family protein refolding chaperone
MPPRHGKMGENITPWSNAVTPVRQAIVALAVSALSPQFAAAETCDFAAAHAHRHVTAAPAASAYAGLEQRAVKALSEQQVADLKAGRGMGLSLPAELNGYAGPAHVVELADALRLSDEQRTKANALFAAMKAETIPLGERIIAEETALERLFAEKRATQIAVNAATARVASAQGDLRAAHLRYHLTMTELLSPEQIARYAELRGYKTPGHHQHGPH